MKKQMSFVPEVFQAVAGKNFVVYAYVNDGRFHVLDMKPLLEKGGVFEPLRDEKIFRETLTVMNQTVAWDLDGTRDEYHCIDIDPCEIAEAPCMSREEEQEIFS